MPDYSIFVGLLTSFFISFFAIPSIIKVAIGKGLYGINRQKETEEQKVPTLGGLAIFAGIIVSINIYSDISLFQELPFITAGAVGLFFIGLKDDILVTAPWWKFLGQVLVALAISIPGGLRLEAPGSFIGFSPGGETVEVLVTVLFIITIINSYNLIDGIDGLAAWIGLLAFLIFGIVFYHEGIGSWTLLSSVIIGSLAGFAWYNVFSKKKKIYMGDTGSLVLGFLLSIMAIRFLNIASPATSMFEIQAPLSFALAVLIIPVFDILRIIIVRIKQGRSPFRPDRQHIHYRMLDMGLSTHQVNGILFGVNIILIVFVLLLQSLGELMCIGMLIFIASGLAFITEMLKRNINHA